MKTFRRIIALAIVLCTLGAMMIPGVSVANAAVGDTTTYSIYSNAHKSLGFGTSQSGAGTGCYWFHNSSYHNWTVMTENYGTNLNWKVEAHSILQARLRTSYATIQTSKSYDTSLRFFAFRIKSPGAGTYSVNVRHRAENTGVNTITTYIFPAPEESFTNYSGTSSQGTLHPYMTEFVKTNESLLTFSAYADAATVKTETGSKTVAVGDGDLIVAFGMQNVGKDDATNNPTFNPLDIYLVEQEAAVDPTDYTVTYYANYEGAEVATKVDEESVVGSTDAMLSVSADPDHFNRPGWWAFAGWATEPGGAAVYQPGDEIILKSDAPALDLYAVWEEVWNPANNTDLIADFDTIFTNAGVDSSEAETAKNSSYIQNNNNTTKLLDTFATNKWTIYTDDAGAVIRPNALYAGGRNRKGHLELRTSQIASYGALVTFPSVFIAPGTGEYKFSVSYGTVASADHKPMEIGAYILEYSSFNKYNVPAPTSSNILTKAFSTNPYPDGKNGSGTLIGNNNVVLEGGEKYLLVFYAISPDTTDAYVNFSGFALTEVKPEAAIEGNNYETVEMAIAAAVSGDTIKLLTDAEMEELNTDEGVVLDLNGKVLTVTGAVVATVTDATGGEGLLAASESSILYTAENELAVWDNTTDAEGYRVFGYTFESVRVDDDQDNVEGIDEEIDFYDYERNFLAQSFDEYGEVAKGAGDYKFNQVLANGNTVIEQIAVDYAAGNTPWRYEYSSQQYQMGRGGLCFSWGAKSIRQFGAGYTAIRMHAPGAGKISIMLDTCSAEDPAGNGGFDMYIVKASELEALCADYAANYAAFADAPATAVTETAAAFATAMENNPKVITGVSDGNIYTGTFEFEEGIEYIFIFNNNGSVKGALHMNFQNIKFNRAEKKGDARTFWSLLKFSNDDAYALVAASDLKVGFNMDWNGDWKDFEFDAATVMAWADKVVAEPETDWGFYIRVSGFEKLAESGTLTATPYIEVKNERVDADPLTFNYELPAAE